MRKGYNFYQPLDGSVSQGRDESGLACGYLKNHSYISAMENAWRFSFSLIYFHFDYFNLS